MKKAAPRRLESICQDDSRAMTVYIHADDNGGNHDHSEENLQVCHLLRLQNLTTGSNTMAVALRDHLTVLAKAALMKAST